MALGHLLAAGWGLEAKRVQLLGHNSLAPSPTTKLSTWLSSPLLLTLPRWRSFQTFPRRPKSSAKPHSFSLKAALCALVGWLEDVWVTRGCQGDEGGR